MRLLYFGEEEENERRRQILYGTKCGTVVINISILIIITTPLYVTPLAVVYIPKRKNKISPFLHTKDGTTSGTSKAAFRGADLARFGSFAF